MILPFAFALAVAFFALLAGPCLPIVGNGTTLLDFVLAAGILGGGTDGGTAKVNGVFAGVYRGVGGRPVNGFTSFDEAFAVSRGFRNMTGSSSHGRMEIDVYVECLKLLPQANALEKRCLVTMTMPRNIVSATSPLSSQPSRLQDHDRGWIYSEANNGMNLNLICLKKQQWDYLNHLVVTFPTFSTTVFSPSFALSNTAFLPVILILPLLHSLEVGAFSGA
jgi:hypothetical protein